MAIYQDVDTKPWYKYFWPWVLITLPGLVVIASMITIVLAVRSSDGVVSDDYYKDGVAINQTFERDARAVQRGLSAALDLNAEENRIHLALSGENIELPLKVSLLHATRKNLDQVMMINHLNFGQAELSVQPLSPGKWYIRVESDPGQWRLSGQMFLPKESRATLH